jgi:hypothetical protein
MKWAAALARIEPEDFCEFHNYRPANANPVPAENGFVEGSRDSWKVGGLLNKALVAPQSNFYTSRAPLSRAFGLGLQDGFNNCQTRPHRTEIRRLLGAEGRLVLETH